MDKPTGTARNEGRIETLAVHAGEPRPAPEGSVVFPIYQGTVYEYDTGTDYHDLKYIRLNSTPTQRYLHDKLAALEGADAAVGYRQRRRDRWHRRLSSRLANAIRNRLTGDRVRDSACSLRVMRRECAAAIPPFSGMHRFVPTLLRMAGYRVVEVPVNHRPRSLGRSKFGVWNRALPALFTLLDVGLAALLLVCLRTLGLWPAAASASGVELYLVALGLVALRDEVRLLVLAGAVTRVAHQPVELAVEARDDLQAVLALLVELVEDLLELRLGPGGLAGLDDERHRLGDRHEEARHLRVRDGNRAAALDPTAEDRDHGARRGEHVPEPHRDEARLDVLARAVRLDDPLAERLRLAHHRLRIDGLVRRDEHEPPRAELGRGLGDDPRA